MAQYHGLVGVIYYIDHHTDQDLTHCDNTVSLLSYDYLNDIRYIGKIIYIYIYIYIYNVKADIYIYLLYAGA